MKVIVIILCLIAVSCQKWQPVCQATAYSGGKDYSVDIYGKRKIANQTQFLSGYPFNWRWVSSSNFKSSNCEKI